MIKWDLIFDAESFYQHYHPIGKLEKNYTERKKYQELVEQHNIIWSNSLRDIYEEYFYENAIDEAEELEIFFDELASYEDDETMAISYKLVGSIEDCEGVEIFIRTANELEHPIIICESELTRHRAKKIKRMTKEEVIRNELDNRIYRNSVVFSKDMYPGDFMHYMDWLHEIFNGEKNIDIIDPYFLSENGIESFLMHYNHCIESGASVNIYSVNRDVGNDYIELLFEKVQERRLKVHLYDVNRYTGFDFHERRIYFNTSQRHVVIGHGLDTIREKDNRSMMRDCHITLDSNMDYRVYFLKNSVYKEVFSS